MSRCTGVHVIRFDVDEREECYSIYHCWLPKDHFQPHRFAALEWPSEKWEQL
ncbi:hypothetical protein SEA_WILLIAMBOONE_3 [Gordonia phage WilliamBoone]|nr:hypothetical protein SEA_WILLIAMBOONE_3 [Gordonia phage WilliamBoone]